MEDWRPVERAQGYLPIADHGLVGDGRTSALIGRDGAVSFLCVPRFDSAPLFASLLDHRRGGTLLLAPARLRASRQRYLPDTAVLVTEMRGPEGTVELTDAFLLDPEARLEDDARAGRGELLRRVRVTQGVAELRCHLRPGPGHDVEAGGDGWVLRGPDRVPTARLRASRPLPGPSGTLVLEAGDELVVSLTWDRARPAADLLPARAREHLEATARVWRRWASHVVADVPHPGLVRRSAITLKLLDHVENGAIIAAPTSSLPEYLHGSRNWDYRYAWIRDTAYAVFALRRIGLPMEAKGFLNWALTAAERDTRPLVLYDVDGLPPPDEVEDPYLEGYRGSAPVRWGNAAARQVQHDVYGELLDCAFQWAAIGGRLDPARWEHLALLAERARTAWSRPDQGIWEVRTQGRPFTYSAAMCQVALDRAARLARRLDLPGDIEGWRRDARDLARRVLEQAWDDGAGALTEHLGGGGLDASLLALPLRRVVPADHPRMAATARAVADTLGAGGGLLYRYLPRVSPDGVDEPEGAFLLCSFWLADNLVGQGRVDEAAELFERLCSYASPLGLLPEQIDPSDGSFLGNFPQAISHVGLMSTAVVLARALRGVRPELATHAWFRG
ncbi:glycoside hydrolase family 15 protein [Streptomyces tirandamycinicus]|uniref:Glycoside hydrolase family 15 n=1 Tax=Streptomyces tirandamycinicus TaxID=2174846 RepID=A0A2S1SM91_9ACTN|nr:glycoside hydrolase family 15 protein [Streptomyces tirandamycinicus]AWI27477.1 glycoside hydrolase family 15 [Streptomyces tirandamycinicus]